MMTVQDLWNGSCKNALSRLSSSAPCSPAKPVIRTHSEPFHIAHKVPVGDTPYVKAKRVQLVDKDPDKAIALFWAAINAGDRVDSALKDMAIVMKQQNRADEAIEAIKSLRSRCSDQAQESLDNILLDLYKRCGRLDDQIALLKHKLLLIQQGMAFNGKRTKTARSQGRKFQVSLEQEATRLLGNLGWALMQKENYTEAEAAYRRALLIGPDNNKMCNLGICLMKQGKVAEARETLKKVRPAMTDGPRGVDSHLKAFERAQEMLRDIESKIHTSGVNGNRDTSIEWALDSKLWALWQPQPCVDVLKSQDQVFADENIDINMMSRTSGKAEQSSIFGNSLRIDAPPFYSRFNSTNQNLDPLGNLKRSRPSADERMAVPMQPQQQPEQKNRRRSLTFEETPLSSPAARWKHLLPDNKAFDDAIVAAVLAPVLEAAASEGREDGGAKFEGSSSLVDRKRLRVFADITHSLRNPRA